MVCAFSKHNIINSTNSKRILFFACISEIYKLAFYVEIRYNSDVDLCLIFPLHLSNLSINFLSQPMFYSHCLYTKTSFSGRNLPEKNTDHTNGDFKHNFYSKMYTIKSINSEKYFCHHKSSPPHVAILYNPCIPFLFVLIALCVHSPSFDIFVSFPFNVTLLPVM